MEFVQPIRDLRVLKSIKDRLLRDGGRRDYMLFVIGINTGLRISDILRLRVRDVKGTHIEIREKKTGKFKRTLLNNSLKNEINKFIATKSDNEYLFKSRKGDNMPITRVQAYRIINHAIRELNITDKTGTHTLRKTFGYHHYQKYKDVALLQGIFNHSAPSITLRYIGISDDLRDRSMESFSL